MKRAAKVVLGAEVRIGVVEKRGPGEGEGEGEGAETQVKVEGWGRRADSVGSQCLH